MALQRHQLPAAKKALQSKKLLSNEHIFVSASGDVDVFAEHNRSRGFDLDPCELLIKFEEAAERLYEDNPQWVLDKYTFIRDERNRRVEKL